MKGARRQAFPAFSATLAGQLVMVLATFIILVTLAVVLVEYLQGRRAGLDERQQRLLAEAEASAERLGRDLGERARAIATWPALDPAQDIAIEDVDKRLATSLQRLAGALGPGDAAVATDTMGRIVAASEPALIGVPAARDPRFMNARCASTGTLQGLARPIVDSATVLFAAPVWERASAGLVGCVFLSTRWTSLVMRALPRATRDNLFVLASDVVVWRGALWQGEGTIVRGAAVRTGGTVPLEVRAAEHPELALSAVRARGRAAVLVGAAVLLVTLPAAVVVARRTARPIRALTDSARALHEAGARPLPPPGPGAPVEVHQLHAALETMIGRLERAQRAMADREALASLGLLSASLAHEIRTPLAVIHGSAELLGRGQPPERTRELTTLVEDEVRRLDRLVADLLAFARPREPVMEHGDLADVVARACVTLAPQATERDVALASAAMPARAAFDVEQLLQVALNMGSNAIQLSPPGATVRISCGTDAGDAWLSVTDQGPGIPEGQREEIFKPFFTTRRQGTGLGLAIVRKIVEAHHGRITITSDAGGTDMRVALPADP